VHFHFTTSMSYNFHYVISTVHFHWSMEFQTSSFLMNINNNTKQNILFTSNFFLLGLHWCMNMNVI
jgi:hypothetical protein